MSSDRHEPSLASSSEFELRALRDAILNDWIVVTVRSSAALAAMQRSLSWRVTKPLRFIRTLGNVARDRGAGPALESAAVVLARRLMSR
jgi:hypothetical protein